jgi:hypothetical protein
MIGPAMTNWTAIAPINPEKSSFLHDRGNRPAAPAQDRASLARRYLVHGLGLVLTCGLVALAFQTRDSWMVGRDWVVPAVVPAAAIGGVALAHLLARRQWDAAAPAVLFLLVAVSLMGGNVWRGQLVEGSDTQRDLLAIGTAVAMGLMVAAALFGLVWVEAKHPTRAPQAEM